MESEDKSVNMLKAPIGLLLCLSKDGFNRLLPIMPA